MTEKGKEQNALFIIFGATGDLAQRKLCYIEEIGRETG